MVSQRATQNHPGELSHPRYILDVLAGPTATAAHKNKERIRISLSLRRKIKTNPENRTEDEE
jgi:hypothetical protein